VPFTADEQPKIADLRQDLWRQIKQLDKDKVPQNR
jgi:putative membrane protein